MSYMIVDDGKVRTALFPIGDGKVEVIITDYDRGVSAKVIGENGKEVIKKARKALADIK